MKLQRTPFSPFRIILACLPLLFFVLNAHAQSEVIFKGYVLNAYDSMPVEGAHIFRAEDNYGTFADVLGHFSLKVNHHDTLYVSSIGFGKQKLLISLIANSGVLQSIVWLVPQPFWLEGVTVTPDVIIEPNFRMTLMDTDSSFNPSPKDKEVEFSGGGVTGLVTLLANQFNNDYKQIKQLRQIKEEEYRIWYEKQVIRKRLNVTFVTKNTNLLSNEVRDFINFWSPSILWLERASDYEIILKMKAIELDYINHIKYSQGNSDTSQATTLELRQLLDN